MYRSAIAQLKYWKDSSNRKPLIIQGARQVGKTWIMKEFGRLYYDDVVYINFEDANSLKELFNHSLNPADIVQGIEIYAQKKIFSDTTLIIFDEVQEVPRALTSLKYFCEQAPEFNIVCAGSMLGIALHEGTSFPVGKVDFLELHPLSFSEFLIAIGEERVVELLNQKNFDMIKALKQTIIERLKQYYFVGGMPEVVLSFSKDGDFIKARELQSSILNSYEQDFSKHAPARIVPKIREVWNSLPVHLSKKNKKFVYGLIREGARAKDYEVAIMWLTDCGLLHKVCRVKKPHLPLKSYEDRRAFKLFAHDVGLLGCMSGLDLESVLQGNEIFTEFKGALTEQYVCQELKSGGISNLFYYTNDRGTCEIDFLAQLQGDVIPVEVKAETNLKSKSLRTYREKYSPEISIRASMSDYSVEEGLVNLPLYLVNSLAEIVTNSHEL